jgi:alkanesulfonate monooxygenase SsuD/methylene tetrahydromethanopterin reductase-like flavin-dependent oxidoreductase (luciferase family)
VGFQDHPYQWRYHDTWTLIAYLAARTSTVRFFPDVANLPLRPPAVLAKAAASLDVLSGGRVELGLGAGAFWDAVVAMGGPRRTPREAFEAVGEAIDVIRLVWSGQRGVRYDGRHYRLSGVHTGPTPAHDIGIWLGASGPKMLDLIGRKADGWVPSSSWAPPESLPGYLRRIEESAVAAGREPMAIRRVYNLMGSIGPTTGQRFVGPASRWVDELGRLAEVGMDAFVFWPSGPDPVDQVERLPPRWPPPCGPDRMRVHPADGTIGGCPRRTPNDRPIGPASHAGRSPSPSGWSCYWGSPRDGGTCGSPTGGHR